MPILERLMCRIGPDDLFEPVVGIEHHAEEIEVALQLVFGDTLNRRNQLQRKLCLFSQEFVCALPTT